MKRVVTRGTAAACVVASLGAGGMVPSTALAQQASLSGSIEEVLVTARRREENLQTVPIAISAFGAEQMEVRAIENMEDLNKIVPNLMISPQGIAGGARGAFSVRGIPGVAVYVDGVVRSGDLGILFDMVELERVEALRGPQGTLFGRNAIGGAIQYVTKAPSDQYGARVQATVGNFDRIDITGNVDVPLTETLLSKITIAKTARDGFVESTKTDRGYGSENNTNVRFQLQWKPTESFVGRFTGEYINDESNHQPRVLIGLTPNSNVPLYALVGDPITSTEIYGARQEYKTSMDWDGPGFGTKSYNLALTLDWTLSDSWAIKSLTGWRTTEQYNFNDSDATGHDLFQHWFIYERDELSQELQAQYSSDRLSGVVGLYYFADDQVQHLIRWSGNELQRGANLALLQSLGARCGPPTAPLGPCDFDASDLNSYANDGWAAFSEWTYKWTDRLSATVGLRYTSVKQETGQYRSVLLPTATSASPPNPLTHICCDLFYDIVPGDPFFEGSAESSQVTPRASLQYQFSPDVMAYVTYSEGFNEGGIAFFAGQSKAYEPEVLVNYEAGIRSDLFDKRLRLNGTVFYGDWSKIQVREQFLDPVTGAPRVLTTNAGAAEVKGLEIEGAWQVTDPFRVNFAYGYLDTKYTDVGRTTQIGLNTPFSFAPKTSYNLGAAYSWSMAGDSSVVFSADYSWRSDFVMERATASQIDQSAYGLLGARLTYKPSGGNWDAALFGTNLTNEYFAVAGFAIPPDGIRAIVLGRPREFGLTMNFRF